MATTKKTTTTALAIKSNARIPEDYRTALADLQLELTWTRWFKDETITVPTAQAMPAALATEVAGKFGDDVEAGQLYVLREMLTEEQYASVMSMPQVEFIAFNAAWGGQRLTGAQLEAIVTGKGPDAVPAADETGEGEELPLGES